MSEPHEPKKLVRVEFAGRVVYFEVPGEYNEGWADQMIGDLKKLMPDPAGRVTFTELHAIIFEAPCEDCGGEAEGHELECPH